MFTKRTGWVLIGALLLVPAGRGRAAEDDKDKKMLARLAAARLAAAAVKDGKFDSAGADAAYAGAFRAYGIDVTSPKAADALRASGIRAALGAALDDWARARRSAGKGKTPTWRQLLALARKADPDPWRNRLRDALEKPDRTALRKLAADPAALAQAATTVVLADALAGVGAEAEAVALLRQAQRRHPADFWINQNLGRALQQGKPPQLDEAIRFLTVAVALRPGSPGAHLNLGVALKDRGRLAEAVACFREALRLDPKDAKAHNNLGNALAAKGELDGAIRCYQQAIRLDPKFAQAHTNLGTALAGKGKVDEAIASLRQAIALDPKHAPAHNNLGKMLLARGQFAEAIASFRKALALDPKYVPAHLGLGNVLTQQGKPAEAEACYRRALALDPKFAPAHYGLATVLKLQGKRAEAEAALRRYKELTKRPAGKPAP
jgi:tetratricopeptide (TPR) repeat protein